MPHIFQFFLSPENGRTFPWNRKIGRNRFAAKWGPQTKSFGQKQLWIHKSNRGREGIKKILAHLDQIANCDLVLTKRWWSPTNFLIASNRMNWTYLDEAAGHIKRIYKWFHTYTIADRSRHSLEKMRKRVTIKQMKQTWQCTSYNRIQSVEG